VAAAAKDRYVIQSVQEALELLAEIGRASTAGVTDLGKRLTLQKNKVFRLLATLEAAGYVEQVEVAGAYRLAAGCLAPARAYLEHNQLVERARGALAALAKDVHETAVLAVRAADAAVAIAVALPSHPVHYRISPGAVLPLHATAAGRVLLAERSSGSESSLPSRLEAFTSLTVGSPQALQGLVDGVRRAGYATENGEFVEECASLAVPLATGAGAPEAAALAIHGPSHRMAPNRVEGELLPALRRAAATLASAVALTG